MSTNLVLSPSNATPTEKEALKHLVARLRSSGIPDDELLGNLGLYLRRQDLSRIFFLAELYQKILDVPGKVFEFGVRWGQGVSLFQSFRGLFEPYNYTRHIVGFDTFSGFPSTHEKDGSSSHVAVGAYGVNVDWKTELKQILASQAAQSPLSHVHRTDLIEGDAVETLDRYLQEHPETLVALAYFDFDIYEPTRRCLELIGPRLMKGAVVAFDELNHGGFPGETRALLEWLGGDRVRLHRSPYAPYPSWFVVE